MRIGKRRTLVVGTVVTFFCFASFSVSAASMEDVARAVGVSHDEAWRTAFAAELEHLGEGSRIAGASYAAAIKAFKGQQIDGTPSEAARLVFAVVARVDRELRRGEVPGKVVLDARRAVARLEASERAFGESAQLRLRRQLWGMGPYIYGQLGQRPGPQGGPGSRGGPAGGNPAGGGSRGRTESPGAASSEGNLDY